ncbi:MAG: KpsF/GutQ family sugar-phosphate isomerase [Gammaproteobacteria bacterium]|nr:KpsF/GutQ family sugar-phosphate isomerase [Gammaproteobacteria bacterium]
MKNLDPKLNLLEEMRRALVTEGHAVLDLADTLGAEAEQALALLYNCRGKVILTGLGKSGLIARKIAATLSSTGTPALYLHPVDALHGDLGVLHADDLAIALSNSGGTEEVLRLLAPMKRVGIPVIALTGNRDSELARRATVHLYAGAAREACPLNLAPTASTTAALAMGDALAVTLLAMRGFQPDDYKLFHPGGSLGRKLMTTVADLMDTGARMPVVRAWQNVGEVVAVVLEKNFGVTCVVDADGRLAGSFSAGDLLRLHIRDRSLAFLGRPVADFMTVNPRHIGPEALAAEALNLMEKHNIRALFVVNDAGEPIGIIGLYEVLKAIDY